MQNQKMNMPHCTRTVYCAQPRYSEMRGDRGSGCCPQCTFLSPAHTPSVQSPGCIEDNISRGISQISPSLHPSPPPPPSRLLLLPLLLALLNHPLAPRPPNHPPSRLLLLLLFALLTTPSPLAAPPNSQAFILQTGSLLVPVIARRAIVLALCTHTHTHTHTQTDFVQKIRHG